MKSTFLSKNKVFIILSMIVLIGIFLRLYHLGKQSIWLDEARAFFRAQKTIQALWTSQINESNPPLYDTLLHYFLKFKGGRNEFDIRMLSAIFGIMLASLAFLAGKYIFSQRVGLIFSLLVAISPYHIYYSQDAKMYSLLSFLSLASFLLFYESIKNNKVIYWIGYALVTALLIYCHNYGLLLFIAQILICPLVYKKYSKNYAMLLVSFPFLILISMLRVKYLFWQAVWDYNPWIKFPSPSDIIQTFKYFSVLCWHMQITSSVIVALIIGIPIYLFLLVFAMFSRHKEEDDKNSNLNLSERLRFAILYLFLPIAIAILISFKKPVYVAGRYDMSVFPAFGLLISFGLDKIKKSILRNLLLVGILLSTILSLYNYYFIFNKSNDRLIADYVRSERDKGTIWVFTDLSLYTFRYYFKEEAPPNVFSFPITDSGWLTRKAIDAEPGYVASEIAKLKEKIGPFLINKNYLRVMCTDIKINQQLIESLKKEYKLLDIINFAPGRTDNQINHVYVFKINSK